MNIDKLILSTYAHPTTSGFGSLMNIDKLIQSLENQLANFSFGSLMNIDKLIQVFHLLCYRICFGSLMNIKLKETACGILFCKLFFYNQRGDRGTAFFGII